MIIIIVKIRADIEVTCFTYEGIFNRHIIYIHHDHHHISYIIMNFEGIDAIKAALTEGEAKGTLDAINYLSICRSIYSSSIESSIHLSSMLLLQVSFTHLLSYYHTFVTYCTYWKRYLGSSSKDQTHRSTYVCDDMHDSRQGQWNRNDESIHCCYPGMYRCERVSIITKELLDW
jgi:hypothetical protein